MRDTNDEPGFGPAGPERLNALREQMRIQKVNGFIVPRADEFQGEYVPPSAMRLAWLTGFTGSAGIAVVLEDKAAVFVDGRYTLQVRQEVDPALFEPVAMAECSHTSWLAQNLRPMDRLGFDPWLHTPEQVKSLSEAAERAGAVIQPCTTNPLDAAWRDRPAAPTALTVPHPVAFAGIDSASKRSEIAQSLTKDRQDAVVLTDPASIAWVLNIRGGDVGYTPLPLSWAILTTDAKVRLFLDPAKETPALAGHLGPDVTILAPADFPAALRDLGGRTVRLDPGQSAFAIFDILEKAGATVVRASDPCILPKACKNTVELAGTRAAHRRDGIALVRFLAWLDAQTGIDELTASDKLEELRAEEEHFRGLSFPTIAGSGPNGAIVHYRSTPQSNRALNPGDLFLLDSGAQYLDGTTDVTRTMAIGQPGDEERERFTLVLKGHIAISRAVFPAGTAGSQLDVLARQSLWRHGLDYDHGTGHGVGSFLSVHEGPHRISKAAGTPVALRPGMVVSNEPGYYKTGCYGIRIENLVTVVSAPAPAGAERELLAFETLTLAPYDRRLIVAALLDAEERAWIDAYHARVLTTLGPALDGPTLAWLREATRPIQEA